MRTGSADAAWRSPPGDATAEISVFGPGKGESIVAHLGFGHWMVVDSCIDRDTRRPVALDYLAALGVDGAEQIAVVAASHWHDDHIEGLAQIVAAAQRTTFFFSMALQCHSFLTLVKATGERSLMANPGAAEFAKIIRLLEERVRERGLSFAPQPVVAHTILWRPPADQEENWSPRTRVEALSPSQRSVQVGLREFAQLLPTEYSLKRRLTNVTPNHTSLVALSVIDEAIALLGGDLQETNSPVRGWSEILGSSRRPPERAGVVKLAHHGADNSDHPDIWSKLLTSGPIAALAPFNRGRTPRPSPSDLRRICANANAAFSSTARPDVARQRRDSHTERMLRARRHPIRPTVGEMGQVRLRRPFHDEAATWAVELFGAATPLCEGQRVA